MRVDESQVQVVMLEGGERGGLYMLGRARDSFHPERRH